MDKVKISIFFILLILGQTASAACKPLKIQRSLSNTSWGWEYSKEQVLAGQRSQRFEVRPGDCHGDIKWNDCAMNRERSEISVTDPRFLPGSQTAISLNIYLPKDFKDSNKVRTTLAQIHSRGGPKGTAGGLPAKPPLIQFDLFSGNFKMCWHRLSGKDGDIKDECVWHDLTTLDQMVGRWTKLNFEFNTDLQKGSARVWINDQQKVNIQHPLVNYRPEHFFFKYGIYRSFVTRHGGPLPTQIAFFDEIKIANTIEEIEKSCTKTVD